MVFHWSFSDRKSPQVSRTLLSILAVLSNVVVWMVSTRPTTSKSSSPFNNHLVTVLKAPITIGINVTFMFHSFSIPLRGGVTYPSCHFLSVLICGQPVQQSPQFCKFSIFCWLLWGLVFWSRLCDPSVRQSPIGVYVCHSLGQLLGCSYTIFRMVKFEFFAHLPVDYFVHPVVSSLILFPG